MVMEICVEQEKLTCDYKKINRSDKKMINEIFGELTELVGLDESFFSEDTNIFEVSESESLGSIEYLSEVDEIRVNETAEIMTDIFTKDVLTSWPEMSIDDKTAKLNEYFIKAGKNLNIETNGVIIESIPSNDPNSITLGYNSADGYIHINYDVLKDPSQLGDILDTATHEMRHQFQADALENPLTFSDIPRDILDQWQYEWTPGNYISAEYDLQGYYEQEIECDARYFAESVMKSFADKMNLN